MPYWNRQKELNRSLEAYRKHYQGLEISICDDGSRIPVSAPGCVITTLPRKDIGMNPCVPMNASVRASTRDIIVLTNPEIEHREPVFAEMLSMLEGPLDYVAAACRDTDGSMLAGEGVRYERVIPHRAHFHFCAMLHRSLFDAAGGFDERYRMGRGYEDADFLWRLHHAGARFRLAKATVTHYRTWHQHVGSIDTNARIYDETWRGVE
jgi:hypothetical protein